ncbi:MAG: hypothetical protein QOG55_2388 [Acidobacteriaceae bacterium]|jgi:hypothetical protein|nr:hypothetical protein [Acidobacteriaceae bacterium]
MLRFSGLILFLAASGFLYESNSEPAPVDCERHFPLRLPEARVANA